MFKRTYSAEELQQYIDIRELVSPLELERCYAEIERQQKLIERAKALARAVRDECHDGYLCHEQAGAFLYGDTEGGVGG